MRRLRGPLVNLLRQQVRPTLISCGVSRISQRTSLCSALGSLLGSDPLHACSHAPCRRTSYAFQYPSGGPSRLLWTFDLGPAETRVKLDPTPARSGLTCSHFWNNQGTGSEILHLVTVWKRACYCSTNKDAHEAVVPLVVKTKWHHITWNTMCSK